MESTNLEKIVRQLSDPARLAGRRVAFVAGNFNVLHPGHLRLLNFAAECADHLIVGLNPDTSDTVFVKDQLRLESVRGIGVVDDVFIIQNSLDEVLLSIKPDVVVKGSEHKNRYNPEQAIVESYGGRLIFSSGDVRFSSLDLLQRELLEMNPSTIVKSDPYISRHSISLERMELIVSNFESVRVVVIGDLIVDEYITCDPLGMSQEDPTIVVAPIKNDLFIGGAGIVAAHAKGLGASVNYFGVVGDDKTAAWADSALKKHGVNAKLIIDQSRPTTLKQRFRARGKTLLRVSHLRQHGISNEIAEQLFDNVVALLSSADVLIFSDFNYGCLPQELVERIISEAEKNGVLMVADSQASSQIGDVSRFKGMQMITPTEHEARLATRDSESGLVTLADSLMSKSRSTHVLMTLGAEGVLVYSPSTPSSGLITDQLPAFNQVPKDVAGAGDSLLISAAIALAVGASIWEAAFIGSVAAACQVGRVGNLPLSASDLIKEIRQ